MRGSRRYACLALVGLLLGPFNLVAELPTKSEIIATMDLVNTHYMNQRPDPGDPNWIHSAYFEGEMAFYAIYPDERLYDYAVLWGERNSWLPQGGISTRHADNQACGQTYIDLYRISGNEQWIHGIKASIDSMVASTKSDDWWWVDALQMAMPVFAKLGNEFDDAVYFNKLYDLYSHTKYSEGGCGLYSDNGCYRFDDSLWWRDREFLPPVESPNDLMVYWSRGNGWVVAAHVRTLREMSTADPHYDEYRDTFLDMCASLRDRQREDGFWNVNLDDPNHYAGPEESGTGFFIFAIAWGINANLLSCTDFLPTVEKGWKALESAVHHDGAVGYVQGVGHAPRDSQPVTYRSQREYGEGSFLLAGSEVVQLARGEMPVPEMAARYEAEDAKVGSGAVSIVYSGYKGTGYVDLDRVAGSYVEWTVDIPESEERQFAIRYASGVTEDRAMEITLNGTKVKDSSFTSTTDWSLWSRKYFKIDLKAGENRIRATALTENGGPNLDCLEDWGEYRGTWYSAPDFISQYGLDPESADRITVTYDVTPLQNNIDGVTGFADSSVSISGYSSHAILVRMNGTGFFDARDGSRYRALSPVPYTAGTKYTVVVDGDMVAKTYDVTVIPEFGTPKVVGRDFMFRTDAPATDDLGKVCLVSGDEHFKIDNLALRQNAWTRVGSHYVMASFARSPDLPNNAMDGDLESKWSARGQGQWLICDLKEYDWISGISTAHHLGDQRRYSFIVAVSDDGESFTEVAHITTSGTTTSLEHHAFSAKGRYVKITGMGNSADDWNNFNEVELGIGRRKAGKRRG
ncbi:MAG: carbohydrate-binding protein [bacterium]|nr:carbohydrate-binding protein [bacterium]